MDLKKIIKKLGAVIFGSGATQVINFVFGIILVRILTVTEYATYKQGMVILNIAMTFFFIISPLSLSYFFSRAKDRNEQVKIVYNSLFSLIMCSMLGAVLLFVFKDNVGALYNNPHLSKYMNYFSLVIFFETLSSIYTYYLVSNNKYKKNLVTTITFAILRILALGMSFIFKDNIFEAFMIFYTVSIAIKGVYIIYDILSDFKGVKYEFDKSMFISQVKFSIPLMIVSIINILNLNLDKNIVSMLYDPDKFALYVNGAFEIPFISIITTSIVTVLLPEISRHYDDKNKESLNEAVSSFKKIINIQMIVMIPLTFALLLFSEQIVVILFSRKYLLSLNLFKIYLFILIVKSFNVSVLLTAADKQKVIVKSGIYMILTNFVSILLINEFLGFNYITLGPLIATGVLCISLIKDTKKIYQQDTVFNIIPIKDISKMLCINVVVYIIMKQLFTFTNFISVTNAIILGPVVFVLLLLITLYFASDYRLKSILKKK